MDINVDNCCDDPNRQNSSEFVDIPLGSAEFEIDRLSRRTSSQSDDNSIFPFDPLFGDLAEDEDVDTLPSILTDNSRVVSLDPIVSLNPIRLPFESSLLTQTNIELTKIHSQSQQSSVTLSPVPPIPSKRGPGRPRKDGKVPIQRKNLFPGRPRMRGRKTLNALGVGSNPSSDMQSSKPTLSSFNINTGLSIKPISGNTIPRVPSDSGRVELTISSSSFASQMSSNLSISDSNDSNIESESKSNLKFCIFCNLSDNSSLCLGELIRCEPSPGFNPLKRSIRLRKSPEDEVIAGTSLSGDASICSPVRSASKDSKFARRGTDAQKVIPGPLDELNIIGFNEESTIMNLFEASGHCWAHHCCAAWSEGVQQNEESVFLNVDKAVCLGSQQRCFQCRKLGATIGCQSNPKCNRYYHYACAVISGTFQDIRSLSMLCVSHSSQALTLSKNEAFCQNCEKSGNISDLLFCTSCGHHYHGLCLDPPVTASASVRAGWQCPHCKLCQTCHQPGDDNKMLVCDTCDKGYHTFCLRPIMSTVPKHGWKCKNCRVCGDCGSRTPGNGPSSRWHMNYSVCDSCYQQRNKGSSCPVCGKAYRQACQSEMLQCITCRKLIHPNCEPKLSHRNDLNFAELANNYVCKVCETSSSSANQENREDFPNAGLPDNIFNASRESFGSFTEDSLGSIDNIEVQPLGSGFDSSEAKQTTTPFSGNSQSLIRPPVPMSGKLSGKKRLNFPGKMRGGKFPGRKRAKTVEFRRKRGPKAKFKPFAGPSSSLAMASSGILSSVGSGGQETEIREKIKDDDPTNENKVILCSAKDDFVLSQDLCAMCGSAGQADEGRLISCSQCGQCYHPFCVNIKVTKVVLNKGWRCLECTVCEGCGLPHDEARLLLCDDCDISYHTYCLDPPLDVVPQGTWKCRWCVVCLKCKSTNPGYGSLWQKNYTECGPCASQTTCPSCQTDYSESDLIIQCIQCNRWLHSKCDGMTTEDDCESAADFGYHCLLCRPKDELPPHLQARKISALTAKQAIISVKPNNNELITQLTNEKTLIRRDSEDSIASKTSVSAVVTTQLSQSSTPVSTTCLTPTNIRVVAPKAQPQYHLIDGIWLSDRGLSQIKSLQLEQQKRTRVKRGSKQTLNAIKSEETDDVVKEDDIGSLEDKVNDEGNGIKNDENGEKKKRQRRLHKLGIGGFSVKQRGRMSASKDNEETNGSNFDFDFNGNELNSNQESVGADKPRRRRRVSKKKNQLQDSFPQYMQEAFFGKILLDSSQNETNQSIGSNSINTLSEDEEIPSKNIGNDKLIVLTPTEIAVVNSHKPKTEQISRAIDERSSSPLDDDLQDSEDIQDFLPPLPPDDELMDILINEEGLDRNDESLDNLSVDGKETETNTKEDAIDLLSPHFNLEGIVGGSSLPQMDSKDVEDLFKGVLSPHNEDSNDFNAILNQSAPPINNNKNLMPIQIPPPPLTSPLAPPSTQNLMPASSVPLPQLMHSKQSTGDTTVTVPIMENPYNMPTPSPFPLSLSEAPSAQYSPQITEPQSPWPSEVDEQMTSQGQKNMIKWESDEALGSMATISPVLYANLNHPNLKTEYPNWNDRIKQISKLWRQLPTDQRQPFLQKARENRAANRIQKANSETQRSGKEIRTPPVANVAVRDVDNERQWKHLQAARQQQQVQHQQTLHEQQRQSIMKPQPMGPISPGADPSRQSFIHSIPQSPSRLVPEYGQTSESAPPMTSMPHSPMQSPVQTHPVQVPFAQSMNRPQVQSPSAASPMSPVIQVSRVRPPIDPNKLPISSTGCKPMQYDPYAHPPNTPRPQMTIQPILRPGTPQQRSPFSPSSPGASHQNPLSQTSSDNFQTPPSTPRPQSNDPHIQTSMPLSPYGQPRTPLSSPFSPTHPMISQNPQQCVDSYSVPNPIQRPQQSFGSEYHNNNNENIQNNECLYQNMGQRIPQRAPDSYNQNMSSPNTDPYSRSVPTPQPPQSPQNEMSKMSGQNTVTDIYARQPMTPRPQQPIQRSQFDEIYLHQPPTPRMPQQSDMYSQSPTSRPNFAQPSQTPPLQASPQHDPYAYQPNTPRPVMTSRPTMQTIRPVLMRPPPPAPIDPYARQPATPMPPPLQDPYSKPPGTPMPLSPNDRPQEPNDTQLSRQHLRDLLQRQQVRRQQGSDVPPRLWTANNQNRIPLNDGQFRLPIPPGAMNRPRMPSGFSSEQVFRHPANSGDQRMIIQRMPDPRMRQVLVQQTQHQFAGRGQPQWVRVPAQTHMTGPQPQLQQNTDMTQYNQMMSPGISRMPPPGASFASPAIRAVRAPFTRPAQPSQQIGLQNNELIQNQSSQPQSPELNQNLSNTPQTTEPKVEVQTTTQTPTKTPTTSDIIKQLQEQQNPELNEEECSPEDLDDDELLGLGNDFNILEYADPELDKALSGKTGGKSNIFDEHLDDLDDKEDVDEKNKTKNDKNERKESQISGETFEKKPEIKQENTPNIAVKPINRMPAPIQTTNVRMAYVPPPPPPPPYPGQQEVSQLPPPPPYPQMPPIRQMTPNIRPNMTPNIHVVECVDPQSQIRPTPLLQEQPLLLEELVEQEKRDQRQSIPAHHRTYGQQLPENIVPQSDSLLSDVEFERLKADILSDDPMQGPNISTIQTTHPQQQQQMHGYGQQMPSLNQSAHWQNESYPSQPRMPQMGPRMVSNQRHQIFQNVAINQMGVRMVPNVRQTHQMIPNPSQSAPIRHMVSLPPPPTPPAEPMNEMERQQQHQYENWLLQHSNALTQQQKYLETEVAKLRKAKKMLSTKKRQCQKNQNELSEQDSNELNRVTVEQSSLQKHLEQIRKSLRQHQIVSNEYQKQRQKHSMVGVSQTSISLPQSPGSSSIPSMQTSPRSVHSPLMALGSSAPGTPIAMGGPATPQSPAIMSPSPLGPSASPLMQNSPIPSLHSPAGMPPSPMLQSVQSPMPPPMPTDPNIRPQMSSQSVHIIDDNNPFSDIYQQKEKMQIQSMRGPTQTAPPNTYSHMISGDMSSVDERQKMFRQMPFHSEENISYQQTLPHPSQPMGQPIRAMQTQHPTSHYQQSNESQMFRFPTQHHLPPQRPYSELVGQPYPAQLPPNYQQQQQQQQQHPQMNIRRPPPPPYPGSMTQMAQQQQQHMRMYGSPQVVPMSRMAAHPMHTRMEYPPRTPSHEFDSNQFVENMNSFSGNSEDNQMVQCSPRHTPVSSAYSLSDDNSMHLSAPDLSTVNSGDILNVNQNNELLSDLQSNEQKPSLVGEAKTSLTFNIDEQGSGQDNDAVNDLLMNANDSNKEREEQKIINPEIKIKKESEDTSSGTSHPNQSNENQIEIKPEQDFTYSSSCALENHSKSDQWNRNSIEGLDIENPIIKLSQNDNSSNNLLNDINESDNNEDSVHNKQNALLKQLLQNCPSADSQTNAIESLIKANEEQNETNSNINENNVNINTNNNNNNNNNDNNNNNNNNSNNNNMQTPEDMIPSLESIVESEPKIDEILPKVEMESTCVGPISTPTNISEPILSTSSTLLLSVSPEKKMSYLDIRRAQLEREPTPPPEEIKPKRKRMAKRKESKSPDAISGDPVKPPTKKRSRKASQTRADEDSEVFLATLMTQLRTLPPLQIIEPVIKPNLNVCLPFDMPDLNAKETPLRGSYGNAFLSSSIDFYSTYPFGPNKGQPLTPSLPPSAITNPHTVTTVSMSGSGSSIGMPSTSRGFYNEEFAKNTSHSSLQMPIAYKNGREVNFYLRDCESPDSIVSSSSPETVLYDFPIDSFKGLKFISIDDEEDNQELKDINNNRSSPDIPLIVSIPIRPIPVMPSSLIPQRRVSELDIDKDKENALEINTGIKTKVNASVPLRDAGNVGVTLTLSSADDIRGILTALAKYLDIPAPNSYEIVERTTTPPSQKLGLYQKDSIDSNEDDLNVQNVLNGKIQILKNFCKFCDIVVLNAGIKKKASELSLTAQEQLEEEEEVIFCSTNCYMQFALSHRGNTQEKEAAAVVAHRHSNEAPLNEVKSEKSVVVKHPMDLLPPMSPMMEDDDISDQEVMSLNLSPKLPALPISDPLIATESAMEVDSEESLQLTRSEPLPKKWKEMRYKYWNNQSFEKKIKTEDEEEADDEEAGLLLDKMSICVKPDTESVERRKCILCHETGDGEVDGPSRLLNMDIDKWIHLNCALWSSEVYEMLNGGLMNVDQACKRALTLSCFKCHKTGASLRCYKPRCVNSYHFPCAIKDQCMFFKDKTLLCSQHALKIQSSEEMTSFVVFRRVFVNRDEQKQIASMIHMGDNHLLRIGNLIFVSIGQLLPHQLQAFHTSNYIYPIGYKIIRFYWSWRRFGKRCQYICSINEVDSRPEFVVEIKETGFENIVFREKSPKSVWLKILEPIVKMRSEAKSIKVFTDYITGEDLFGLSEPSIVRILESLPGVDTLNDYNFRYGRSPLLELPLAINPTGCARTEPKLRTHFKRPHRLHVSTTTSSRSSIQSSFSGMEISSPYVKQFVHSKSSQYRKMKMEWRNNVYLARSRIQGLGLYAVKDIEKHTMVIEYIGLLIRNEIAERNERIYEEQNRGVYMFRLDDHRVIDATLSGGLARYVNHSCDPNCVAECVQIDRENKILIIANRRIQRGEELTYDYKFDVEDDQHKIPCLCGAPNCRKWMN